MVSKHRERISREAIAVIHARDAGGSGRVVAAVVSGCIWKVESNGISWWSGGGVRVPGS